jgi:hypothetical protein
MRISNYKKRNADSVPIIIMSVMCILASIVPSLLIIIGAMFYTKKKLAKATTGPFQRYLKNLSTTLKFALLLWVVVEVISAWVVVSMSINHTLTHAMINKIIMWGDIALHSYLAITSIYLFFTFKADYKKLEC